MYNHFISLTRRYINRSLQNIPVDGSVFFFVLFSLRYRANREIIKKKYRVY